MPRIIALREFERLSSLMKSAMLLRRRIEQTLTLEFRGDVFRQYLSNRGVRYNARYRMYEREDLAPLVRRGLYSYISESIVTNNIFETSLIHCTTFYGGFPPCISRSFNH